MLKERRAAEASEMDRREALYLYRVAANLRESGDDARAARIGKRALNLDPDLYPALDLLAQIHLAARQPEQAIFYLNRLRQYPEAFSAHYSLGLVHLELGRHEEARKNFHDFLEASKSAPVRKWKQWRDHASALCQSLPLSSKLPVAAPLQTEKKAARVELAEPVQGEPAKSIPHVSVDFLPVSEPTCAAPNGTLADYLLRRRLLDLRLAQSFEDLICLPSLNGVDTYIYQQETVRRVLRHFKGRALLADEVGLGKTIEACLVLKEYWARGMVRKILVLTPPSLVTQWKGELSEKFGLSAAAPDDPAFRSDPERFWREQALVVASIAMARLEPHASTVAGVDWDMVIVDEAHCLKNRASANWKLVNSLTKKFILMLTATPVENSLIELYNLITVLKPGLLATEAEFRKRFLSPGKAKSPRNPERLRELLGEVMVRNTRSAVDVRLPHRVAASVKVLPSPAEARLYEMVSDYVAARYREEQKYSPILRSTCCNGRPAAARRP